MPRRITRKQTLAGLAASGVLSVGIAAPTVAFAQDDTEPSATPSATATTPAEDEAAGDEERRTGRLTELAEALATELGVSADDVSAALEKLREEMAPEGGPKDGERPEGAGDPQARLQESLDAVTGTGSAAARTG